MAAIALDHILKASQDQVRKSGMLTENIRMGVVSAVASDGTITVDAGDSSFPRVRLLSGYGDPKTGDRVEIANSLGGWVCLGKLVTANPNTWTPLPLASNWLPYNTTQYYAPAYRLTSDGMVQFCGVAKPGTGAPTSGTLTLATMPSAYRPALKVRFSCEVSFNSTTKGVFGVIDINTNGTVQITDFPGDATFAMLDIVQYRLS